MPVNIQEYLLDLRCTQTGDVMCGDIPTRDIYIPADIRNVSYSYAYLLATLAFFFGMFSSLLS